MIRCSYYLVLARETSPYILLPERCTHRYQLLEFVLLSKVSNQIEEDLIILKCEFEDFLVLENNSLSEEFVKNGWKGMFVETYFKGFLEEKIQNQLFPISVDEEASQILQKSDLSEQLREICRKIYHLKEKRQVLIEEKASDLTRVTLCSRI